MKKPLILVVREFEDFSRTLIENGFEVINFPTIATIEAEDLSDFKKKIEELERYDGVFFTSPKAAKVFLENFDKSYDGKIYVLGNRAKKLFENRNFKIVFSKEANTAEEFINSFDGNEFAGRKFLFVKGDKSLRVIPKMLEDIAEIDETIVYKTIESEIDGQLISEMKQKISRKDINFICFFSPSAVESFLNVVENFKQNEIKIAAIGTTTAAKAKEENLKVDFIVADAKNFAAEFVEYLHRS